ncbi:MAG: GNAT family N-acetyltransferase [Candidatus Heimdallarchaeota archaeon]|nr:GNAT family N-acetyltransferase [Candidatus Heimdallarchaeota archaeon]
MTISIKEITADNWIKAVKLEVRSDQKGFVASNAKSIAQSKFQTFLECYGVYENEQMVGFAATGKNPEDGEIWIARYMIGVQYQGKGLGKKGSQKLVSFLQEKHNCSKIFLDVDPENKAAINLYKSLGFKETGKLQGNSLIFELNL